MIIGNQGYGPSLGKLRLVNKLSTICLHLARATYSPAGLKLFESAGLLTFKGNFAHEANDL